MTRREILDVSSHQGNVDFPRIRLLRPQVAGVIIKVNEGTGYLNPFFAAQYDSARRAGLLTGGYSFDRPGVAGTADVDLYLKTVGGRAMELGHWLDCEVTDDLPPATISERLHEDANRLDQATVHHTGIYTGRWFWDPQTRGSGWASALPAWIANYSGSGPDIPFPWKRAMLWQFTDKYQVAGLSLDASVWTGTDLEWSRWTGRSAPVPPTGDRTAEQIVKDTQQIVHAVVDGKWGPDTDRRCESLRAMRDPMNTHNQLLVRGAQGTLGVGVDGDWGDKSRSAWTSSVKKLQLAWGTVADGIWGQGTDSLYLAVSPTR
jgi:GH25 family lysozyme M1 (1,4-beta-N-acetylmuramidase)